eukprot:3835710-Rhodomonas_salina.1
MKDCSIADQRPERAEERKSGFRRHREKACAVHVTMWSRTGKRKSSELNLPALLSRGLDRGRGELMSRFP